MIALLAAAVLSAPTPAIVQRPVPFGAARRAQMAAYSERHYGIRDWRLRPRTIVQHVAVTSSFGSVFATFSRNSPDVELGELPGVCSHYVIDRDGTIYQLVPLSTMCRHTVGLNHVAIGVEHLGMTDAQVLRNTRQLNASVRLTLWLSSRYRIGLRDVIGHNESLRSPFHRERVAAWRCQTHGDFAPAAMRVYRARLASHARAAGVALAAGAARRAAPRC